jgi:hypothetical protein
MHSRFRFKSYGMKSIGLSAVLLGVVLLAADQAAAEPPFQEGKWEITTRMEMPGMPFTPPPMTFQQCLTGEKAVPQKEEPGQKCKMVEQKISGNTVNWTVRCKSSRGTSEARGEVIYEGDRMKGTTRITSNEGGEQMTMTSHMKGHRIGPCGK